MFPDGVCSYILYQRYHCFSSQWQLPRASLISLGMLLLEQPSSLNLTSKQQKMKTELTAYTSTENTRELTMIDPRMVTTISIARSPPSSPLLSSQKQLITDVTPVMKTTPQKTSKPVMMSETDMRPRKRERMPMVVLAELMQFYPVTDITITQLWLRILNRFSRFLRHIDKMQRQTATAMFFVSLRLESTNKRARVMTAMRAAPKTIEPKAEPKSHLYAVRRQFFPQTRQYQKAAETATVKTITQQKTKLKKSQKKNHNTVITPSAVGSSFLLDLSSETLRIQLREQIQKKEKSKFNATLMTGDRKTAHFSLRNCEATFTKMIPISIFFLKQSKTSAQTMKMIKKVMAMARLPMMNPKMARPNRMAIDSTIKAYTITLGISFIRKTQTKLKTSDSARHVAISPAYRLTQRSPCICMSPLRLMQYPPAATNTPSITKKKTRHPTSLQLRLDTGSDRQFEHLELYSSWKLSQLVRRVSLFDMQLLDQLSKLQINYYQYFGQFLYFLP